MNVRLTTSAFAVLSWLKDQQSAGYTSLDHAAEQFKMDRDQMRQNLQWLQRYECVKRGGRANAEWSITELGLVRLASGRFSSAGGFLSAYDPSPSPVKPVTEPLNRPSVVESRDVDEDLPTMLPSE